MPSEGKYAPKSCWERDWVLPLQWWNSQAEHSKRASSIGVVGNTSGLFSPVDWHGPEFFQTVFQKRQVMPMNNKWPAHFMWDTSLHSKPRDGFHFLFYGFHIFILQFFYNFRMPCNISYIYNLLSKLIIKGWGCDSVIEHLSCMYKALVQFPTLLHREINR